MFASTNKLIIAFAISIFVAGFARVTAGFVSDIVQDFKRKFNNEIEHINEVISNILHHELPSAVAHKSNITSDNEVPDVRNSSSLDQTCECGLNDGMNDKIIGGENVPPRKFPWMVALWLQTSFRRIGFKCGASVINEYFVLTAAHCVNGIHSRNILLTFGVENYCRHNVNDKIIRRVESVFMFEKYDKSTGYGDIALLKVAKKVRFTDRIGPICLPKNSDNPYNDDEVIVTGWGDRIKFIPKSISCQLQEATIKTYSTEQCRQQTDYNPRIILNSMICAGDLKGGKDSCQGDSGGPLMYKREDTKYEIIGIVSRGIGCGDPNYLGLYTRITSYLDWIKRIADGTTFCRN